VGRVGLGRKKISTAPRTLWAHDLNDFSNYQNKFSKVRTTERAAYRGLNNPDILLVTPEEPPLVMII
jgi:hypothetical protein